MNVTLKKRADGVSQDACVVERRKKGDGKCKNNNLVLEVYDNIVLFN
jgi:hypothetical protein